MKSKKLKLKKSNPISIGGMLFILFLGLKLTGNIDWNWFIIFSPIILNVIFRSIEIFKIIDETNDDENKQEILDILDKISPNNTEEENNKLREKINNKIFNYLSK